MKKFLVLMGHKGLLCGDPRNPTRYLAQRKLSWADGEMPKQMHERYEPIVRAYPYHRELLRLDAKNNLTSFGMVEADSAEEAIAKLPEAKRAFDLLAVASKAKADAAAKAKTVVEPAPAAPSVPLPKPPAPPSRGSSKKTSSEGDDR